MSIPPEYLNQIVTGDARELARAIPDESVDLIFTDPVYWQVDDYVWLSDFAHRVLKPDAACLMWQGQQWLADTIVGLSGGPLSYRWVLGWYAANNMQMVGKIGRKIAPLLWYEKGRSNPIQGVREIKEAPIPDGRTPFKWAKRIDVVAYYLRKFTNYGDVVLDPFSGGGSVAVAAKMLHRNYTAFEIDPDTAERARLRVEQTQMPLPGLLEEQSEMELTA